MVAFLDALASEATDYLEMLRRLERGWIAARARVPASTSTLVFDRRRATRARNALASRLASAMSLAFSATWIWAAIACLPVHAPHHTEGVL
jgi:hypothetical protein